MSDTKKRKKNYYHQAAKKQKANYLDAGSGKGFLVTFNPKQERKATLTAYALLNEAADRLYGEDEKPKGDDIEAELKVLREETSFRFRKARTEVPSIMFISTTLEKPVEICTNLFENISSTVSHIMRFVPVVGTCKTQMDTVSKKVLDILADTYPVVLGKVQFMIIVKARHNNDYNESDARRKFCMELAKKICDWNSDFAADLKSPELVVNIDILQKVCCISLLPEYTKFKKYNPEQFNEHTVNKNQDNKDKTNLNKNQDIKEDVTPEEKESTDRPRSAIIEKGSQDGIALQKSEAIKTENEVAEVKTDQKE